MIEMASVPRREYEGDCSFAKHSNVPGPFRSRRQRDGVRKVEILLDVGKIQPMVVEIREPFGLAPKGQIIHVF